MKTNIATLQEEYYLVTIDAIAPLKKLACSYS